MSALLPSDGEYEIKLVKKTTAWDRAIAAQKERDALTKRERAARDYAYFLKRNVQTLHPEALESSVSWLEYMNAEILKSLRAPLVWDKNNILDPFGDMWESMPWT